MPTETLSMAASEPSDTTEITNQPDRVHQRPMSDEVASLRSDVDNLQQEVSRIAAANGATDSPWPLGPQGAPRAERGRPTVTRRDPVGGRR